MFRFLFLALMLPLSGVLPAQARPVNPLFMAAGAPEYILFRTVDNSIDCQSLGGPLFAGDFVSEAATIEVDSNIGIQVSYANGADLKSGPSAIPTTFEFALRGLASFDGKIASDTNGYTAFGELPARQPEQSGVIEFASTAGILTKGLKARVVARRRGLQDRAGKYQTEIVLNWARF